MHHVVGVREVERLGDLGDDMHGALGGHGPFEQRGVGVGAVDELHRDPQLAIGGLPAVVDRHDLRVLEGGRHVGLADESCPKVGITRQFGGEHFECGLARQARVGGQVHRAHAPGAQHPLDAVTANHRPVCQHPNTLRSPPYPYGELKRPDPPHPAIV